MKRATEAGTGGALPPTPDALLRILRERWNAANPDYDRSRLDTLRQAQR